MKLHMTGIRIACLALPAGLAFIAQALGQPVITMQPTNQTLPVGGVVSLSVAAESPLVGAGFPQVQSGTLRLWLKADAGVITDASGNVSQWQDQSGNGNDAVQGDPMMQPVLTTDNASTRPVIQFNGIQDGVHGDVLTGSGDVEIPDAMTAFTVYSPSSVSASAEIAWLVGSPGNFGATRGPSFINGDLNFTTWGYDYTAPYTGPLNTLRICADRVDSSLSMLDILDETASFSTNFTLSMQFAASPGAGYTVGGLNFVNPDNFPGEIAEIIIFQGRLTDADRGAMLNYLEEKYYKAGTTNNLSYQWQFNQTNIAGATNSFLVLTNAQLTNSGSYDVVVSDTNGSVTSSDCIVWIGEPPSIVSEPASQDVIQGNTATFSIQAEGTPPFAYQWSANGQLLENETNSILQVIDAQVVNAGLYTVTVTSPFGSIQSSNATLTVDYAPVIITQPASGHIDTGSNAILSVYAVGSTDASGPPPILSGHLQLWLRADQGVQADQDGRVTLWRDQSGNTNDASQANAAMEPLLVSKAPNIGQPVVRFNGIQDGANGSLLTGTNDVGVPNAMTAFTVYDVASATNSANIAWFLGQPPGFGAGRGHSFLNGSLNFTTWAYDYTAPYTGPLNTYRICTDRLDTNLTTAEIFDRSLGFGTNFSFSMINPATPAPGYTVGGLNFSAPDNFAGDLAEILIYRGDLSEQDRLGVVGYLEKKYLLGGPSVSLSYQWQWNGTNIAGATNVFLSLTNLSEAAAGSYDVVISNLVGAVMSSNAVILVGNPPSIASLTPSAAPTLGAPASLSVTAEGTAPLSYQWSFQGAAISDATNSFYNIDSVGFSNLGAYTVTVSNPWQTVVSQPVLLELNPQITVNGELGTNFGFTNIHSVLVQITSLFTNASIFYTLDGSPPDFNSTLYSGPFALGQSAVLRAVAYDQNFNAARSLAVNLTLIISNALTVINPGGGVVTLNPPGGLYRSTQTVQVTATPTNGWQFLQWSGASSSTNPVVSVVMTSPETLHAVFGAPVTLSPISNGAVALFPAQTIFAYGSTVEVTGIPARGRTFELWGGGTLSGNTNPTFLTVNKTNITVSALFSPLAPGHYSLIVLPNGYGTVSISPAQSSFASNAVVMIRAIPQTTNRFFYWSGDFNTAVSSFTFNIRTNTSLVANFTGGVYPLQLSSPVRMGAILQFTLTGTPLQTYEIYTTPDLQTWSFFRSVILPLTGISPVISDVISNTPLRVYQARSH